MHLLVSLLASSFWSHLQRSYSLYIYSSIRYTLLIYPSWNLRTCYNPVILDPKSTKNTCYSVETLQSRPLLVTEFQRNRVDTMTFVGRRSVPFALEDMPQMSTTGSARNLSSDHTMRAILMTGHSTGNGIEERRPPAAALELGSALVERCPAAGASVDALLAVLVIFASPRRLCAFLT